MHALSVCCWRQVFSSSILVKTLTFVRKSEQAAGLNRLRMAYSGYSVEKEKELYAFDDLKIGVKGLSDSGVTRIPRIFIHPPETVKNTAPENGVKLQIPIVDLKDIGNYHAREEMVKEIKDACETWGFFQIVNHGVPLAVMDEMLEGIHRFHEQPAEDKTNLYSRDFKNSVNFYCSGDLKVRAKSAADWRDTLSCRAVDDNWDFEALPQVCRGEVSEYIKNLIELQDVLSELLSEALGLRKDHLARMGCLRSFSLSCHYYPICPEPELTLGTIKHSDPSFLTLVLQDDIGGLQVLHKDQWVDVPPVDGAFVANLGDLMQLVTNNRFKSVEHRVLATPLVKPRISVASFFAPKDSDKRVKPYGPIKELLSENNPPIYRETLYGEYTGYYRVNGQNGSSALANFRLH
ncbi:1-aminocyclopropane-1-carboxylate oxidase homolog 1-like [Argentina anserina]|uniref:1-aminocyclopropane-1-carboxylate oxidase homolog 1-like n=1 Tax=Argentina anserina TaxID=57926 RepID=UPI0021768BC1|nr:1-aminocyclopropane-1-carboxylate oxidase homolog 1-like [Potentilla anserina]